MTTPWWGTVISVASGGVIAGVAPIAADFFKGRRDAKAIVAARELDRKDAAADQRWRAELEGLDAAQDAISAMVSACAAADASPSAIYGKDLATMLNLTKDMTLAISRVLDDEARDASELGANALVEYWHARRTTAPTELRLDSAVSLADRALSALGAVRRGLYQSRTDR